MIYITDLLKKNDGEYRSVIDNEWMEKIPSRFADTAEELKPVTFKHGKFPNKEAYVFGTIDTGNPDFTRYFVRVKVAGKIHTTFICESKDIDFLDNDKVANTEFADAILRDLKASTLMS
jgi:hypothetical protein